MHTQSELSERELSARRSVDVRVSNAMEDSDHPEVPRSLEHRREKQTCHKNRGEHGDGGEPAREMIEVQRPERKDDVADQDSPDGAPASNELGLQDAAVHQFLVKAPEQIREHDRAHTPGEARL